MQGLADGYFVLPYTIQNYLADQIQVPRFKTDAPEFAEAEKQVQDRINRLMNIKGKRSVDSLHKELGHIMWDHVGMARNAERLKEAIEMLKKLKKEFWSNVRIPGKGDDLNVELEKALRLPSRSSRSVEAGSSSCSMAVNDSGSTAACSRAERSNNPARRGSAASAPAVRTSAKTPTAASQPRWATYSSISTTQRTRAAWRAGADMGAVDRKSVV